MTIRISQPHKNDDETSMHRVVSASSVKSNHDIPVSTGVWLNPDQAIVVPYTVPSMVTITRMHDRKWFMAVLCLSVMICGALNSVLGKIRAKPMGSCSYFATILNSIAYVIIYFSIMGLIPKEQFEFVWKSNRQWTRTSIQNLRRPLLSGRNVVISIRTKIITAFESWGAWKYFVLTGLCDCLGNAGAMIAQAFVPGPLYALMNQAALPATALISVLLLHKRYSKLQVAAISCVVVGGITSLVPDLLHVANQSSQCPSSRTVKFGLLTALATLPTALSVATKEKVFILYRTFSKDKFNKSVIEEPRLSVTEHNKAFSNPALDVFILGFHESMFTLLLLPLGFPLNMMFGQYPATSSLDYIKSGVSCFLGLSSPQANLCHVMREKSNIFDDNCEIFGCCEYAMAAYAPYLCINVLLNIGILLLILNASAVVAFMTLKATLPLAIIIFTAIDWPLLSRADTHVSSFTIASLFLVCFGVAWYRYAHERNSPQQDID